LDLRSVSPERTPDIFYTDRSGKRSDEYLSLGCDNVALFKGRTPIQMYSDFMKAFSEEFAPLMGTIITSVSVALGPAGELRYPSYPQDVWRFPGAGEFQCYDAFMLANLKACAVAAGSPEWGFGGPHDAGHYLSRPEETGFSHDETGRWQTRYGRFFLSWYSQQLLGHGERVLGAAAEVFGGVKGLKLVAKLPGVHWLFRTRAHAAELTAGIYNCEGGSGYRPMMKMLAKYDAMASFTCSEMADEELPEAAASSPQQLLIQVRTAAAAAGIRIGGENALPRFDVRAHNNIVANAMEQVRNGPTRPLYFQHCSVLVSPIFACHTRTLCAASARCSSIDIELL
jgi:beta-amylase